MLRSYLRLVLFAAGLLLGVQVPGLINEYTTRVQAHLSESRESLKGFNDTATRFFNGDLRALVAHYRASDDPVFQSDADSIDTLVVRSLMLEREWQIMLGPWYQQAWHLFFTADAGLKQETFDHYDYRIMLSPGAIAWGIACALILAALIETLVAFPAWLVYRDRGAGQPAHWR